MQTTLIVAPVAAVLALLDVTGASRWAEKKVGESLRGILGTGFLGGGLVLLALYSVLWILSCPRRGIVGALVLVVAGAALILEIVQSF